MGDYGASSASAELHLKMSKKIAQLTKVIFHLNTRNEDFQMEFSHLKQVHAIELQQLTQDAAAKLKLLTEQLQAQKDNTAQAEARAAKDKQQFLKDVALFQQQAAAQQSATQKEFQRRVQMLEEQVEQGRRAFVDRIQQLTHVAETQQRSQQSQAMDSAVAVQKELEELKRKHSDEMEQVVMSSNARYTQMLAEQLRLQDALKSELAAERAKWQQSATQEQQALQLQMKKEREDAQTKIEETKHQFVSKMEHLLADLETLRAQEAKLRQEKEELTKALGETQRQTKMLELQVSKAQQVTLSVRKDSEANAQKTQHTLTLATERIDKLSLELETLKKALMERDAALQQAMRERDALQLELLQGSASLSEKHAQHTQQLSERDLKLANLHAELALQQQQTSVAEANAAQKIQVLETRIAEKEKEASDLQQKLASGEMLRTSLQKDKEKALAELKRKLEEAEKTIAMLRAEHGKAIHEQQSSHAQMVESLTNQHKHTLEATKSDADKRIAEVETQQKQHSSASIQKALNDASQQHAHAISQLKVTLESSEGKWKQEKTQLQAQLQQLQAELAAKTKEAADTQTKLVELSAKLKRCEDQVAFLLAEKETMAKTAQKTQKERDEAFQKQLKELTAQNESAVKRLTSEKDRLVTEHKQTLMQIVQEHADKLNKAQSEWESEQKARLSSQNAELSGFYEQQLNELKEQLQTERKSAEQAANAAREQQLQLEDGRQSDAESFHAEVQRLMEKAEQKLVEMERQHQNNMEAALAAHTNEMDRLAVKFKKEKEELLHASVDQVEQKHSQLTAQHTKELEARRAEHAAAIRSLEETLHNQRSTEALALRAEMAHKLKDLRSQKDQEHTRAMAEAKAAHDAQFGALQKQADATQTSLMQRSGELETARRELETAQRALESKTLDFNERVTTLERTNREEVERLKQAAKREMDRLLEENLTETRQLSEQFEETKRLMLDKVTFLKQTIADWEDKYERRESRAEDVMRIAALERSVAEKEALVKQTLDEMAYFKRELLNREEMYNKTFARTPNVGVLQVLKPHVMMQSQLNQMSQQTPTPTPPPLTASSGHGGKRKSVKPSAMMHASEPQSEPLQRRGSERGTAATMATTARKALPPLGNNQVLGL